MSDVQQPKRRGAPPEFYFKAGNPGRPKGSRNAIAESFLTALHKDFQANGAEAIRAARAESPLGYIKMVASLLPQKLEIEKSPQSVTDEELMEVIRAGALTDRMAERDVVPNVGASGTA